MQRRTVTGQSKQAAAASASKGRHGGNDPSYLQRPSVVRPRLLMGRGGGTTLHNTGGRASSFSLSPTTFTTVILCVAAFILTVASYFFPAEVVQVEREGIHQIQQAEANLMEYWHAHHQSEHAHQPPFPVEREISESFENLGSEGISVSKSKVTGSSWVEGEKKLKAALKILAKRQAEGLDIGVPVLTRWLGDDIPAWPSSDTMPETEWREKVKAKYDAMREEEEQWRKEVTKLLETMNHG